MTYIEEFDELQEYPFFFLVSVPQLSCHKIDHLYTFDITVSRVVVTVFLHIWVLYDEGELTGPES